MAHALKQFSLSRMYVHVCTALYALQCMPRYMLEPHVLQKICTGFEVVGSLPLFREKIQTRIPIEYIVHSNGHCTTL